MKEWRPHVLTDVFFTEEELSSEIIIGYDVTIEDCQRANAVEDEILCNLSA